MALRLQFLTLVIPRERMTSCVDLPGFMEALRPQGGILFETSWYDAHLWCDTAMNGLDIDDQIRTWEARGLRAKDELGQWSDLCVCASQQGPVGPCPWLGYEPAQNAVWLLGIEPGPMVGGRDHLASLEADLARFEREGEAAYSAMYEARRPKDDFEDACLGFARAIEVAQFLHREEDAQRLHMRLSLIRSVYDHQMRGF